MEQELLTRIAEALERLAPPKSVASQENAPAWQWHRGAFQSIAGFAPLPLSLLTGIDAQRDAVLTNSRRLASGHAAHDILLWGARGSGKSALVKSTTNALQQQGADLTLFEASSADIGDLPTIFTEISARRRPAIVFLDDLAFEGGAAEARTLRSVLEGGAAARPPFICLYVTSNRRHIVARDLAEQDSAINIRDVVDDRLALADRFGLSLGFHACNQQTWLDMGRAYAAHLGVEFDEQAALTWATQRGARSGRIAWHYAVEIAGQAGKSIGW